MPNTCTSPESVLTPKAPPIVVSATGFYSCEGSKQAQQMEVVAAAARKEPRANPTDPCQGKPDAQSCDALDECTWCKSAAVPSSCFTVVSAAISAGGQDAGCALQNGPWGW